MIYIYIYLLLNLFGTIQLGRVVKRYLGGWEGVIELMRLYDSEGKLVNLTNKQLMTSLSIVLFFAGFIMWLYSEKGV